MTEALTWIIDRRCRNGQNMSDFRANIAECTVAELSAGLKRTVEENHGYARVRGEVSGYNGVYGSSVVG